MKLTESQLRNIVLEEVKKTLNEISNNLLTNAAKSAKDKGRRAQRAIFFKKLANNLNSEYGIEDIFYFFSIGSEIKAKVMYDPDLDESFMTSFEDGQLILTDSYFNKKYTLDEFEHEIVGEFQTPQRRNIMAGLKNLDGIMKQYNEEDNKPINLPGTEPEEGDKTLADLPEKDKKDEKDYDDISDDEIRYINRRES